jgi:hypothetical protein
MSDDYMTPSWHHAVMLFSVPSLQPADRSVLAEIDAMRDKLRLHLTEPRRWNGQLRRNLAARAIAGSNNIEGYVASVEDVEDIMAGEAPVSTGESVAAEIEGYRQAMSYIQRLGSAGSDFAYSKGLLNALHFMMQGQHPVKRPGWSGSAARVIRTAIMTNSRLSARSGNRGGTRCRGCVSAFARITSKRRPSNCASRSPLRCGHGSKKSLSAVSCLIG